MSSQSKPGKLTLVESDSPVVEDNSGAIETVGVDNDDLVKPGALSQEEDASGGLGRHLGVTSATFLIIGRIIGTGIFSTPSSITDSTGSVGAALLLWVLGFLLAFAGLFVWMELGCMIPRSGGEKVYLEAAYPRPKYLATIFFAVQAVVLGFSASGCIIFASNVLIASGHTVSEWAERGIAIGVIVFVTFLHTFTPRLGVYIMNVLGTLKVVLLLFVVITGWVVLSGRVASIPDPHTSFRHAFQGASGTSSNYATALFKILNSFAGWSNVAYVMNEVKRPVRTMKIAGPLGLTICGILYILANVSYYSAATPQEISKSGNTVAAYFFGKVFGSQAKRALSVLVALSALGNVMSITFAQARVNQELAKEGVIPFARFWASAWPVGAPSSGLLLHFIPSFIVIVAIPFGDAYNFILDLEGYPQAVIYLLVGFGLLILRYRSPQADRPFKAWYPVIFFFLAGQAFLVVAPYIRPAGGKGDTKTLPYYLYAVVGIAVLALSVAYWVVWWLVLPFVGGFVWAPRKVKIGHDTFITEFDRQKKH